MIKRLIAAIAVLCGACGLVHAQAESGSASVAVPIRSVWGGVYSAAQASRGEYAYTDDECGGCHGEVLEGASGSPELVGGHFMADWDGQSALDLVRHMHAMPIGDPDDIGIVEATELTAFILQQNNIPAGSSDLPADRRVLARIRIDALKPAEK